MYSVEVSSLNGERGAAILILACDLSAHQGKGSNDPSHRTLADRGIPGKPAGEILTG